MLDDWGNDNGLDLAEKGLTIVVETIKGSTSSVEPITKLGGQDNTVEKETF